MGRGVGVGEAVDSDSGIWSMVVVRLAFPTAQNALKNKQERRRGSFIGTKDS